MNNKKCINEMKKQMNFLSSYTKRLRMMSGFNDGEIIQLRVEDQLVDYIHYTKSIVDCRNHQFNDDNPIIKAMELVEQVKKKRGINNTKAYFLLQAMNELPNLYRDLLSDYYIRCLDVKEILLRQGGIARSTFYRRLDKALLLMYDLLKKA